MTVAALPDPMVPAEVDLRDEPVPLRLFVDLACEQFGWSRAEAEQLVMSYAQQHGLGVEGLH